MISRVILQPSAQVDLRGSQMAARIAAYDWSTTPLGPAEQWPQTLKTTVRMMLTCRYPMFVWWGEHLINIYNDAYVPNLGKRHPEGLGKPAPQVWSEIWDVVGPQTDVVFRQGSSTWNEELLLVMERNGFTEETYFTFAYSPVTDDNGQIAGLLGICTDETARVLGRRRLKTLRDLGDRTSQGKTEEDAIRAAAATLAENDKDIPFALVYLLSADGKSARLTEAVNLEVGSAPASADVTVGSVNDVWDFARLLETRASRHVENVSETFGLFAAGAWPEPIESAMVLPLAKAGGQDVTAGFLVAGISPRLSFDDEYRGFFDLTAVHIATAIANARAYEEERQRAEALAQIDRAKTAFFSNVSHEFRTPLTLMLGPLEEMLKDSGALPAAQREHLETAHRNSLRLLKLVNSLLDFSRIEAGRIRASYAPVDLAPLTADLASNFRSAMQSAGLELIVDCQPLPEPVYIDREMWEKIVLNLLSNAFKFTFEGRITVRVEARGDHAVLTVADTGAGIPEAELPHIFERFRRVEGAKGRTYEGTGIGLALIQELVKLHGGTVAVESHFGEGSTFTVAIPFGKAHLPADHIAAASTHSATAVRPEAFTGEAITWVARERLAHPSEALPAASPVAGPRPTILLADDNADMREHLSNVLSGAYEITAVGDGESALRAARANKPDLILSDVMMPVLDGFALLQELRGDANLREIPVILLSARAGEEARTEGLAAGADDYVTKPFTAKELAARVETTLSLQRLRRAMRVEFETLLNQAPMGVYLVDSDFRLREVNPTARPVFGNIPDLIGRDFDEVLHILWPRELADQIVGRFRHTLETGEPYLAPEFIHDRSDRGVREFYEWHIYRIPLPEGSVGVVCYFRDISTQVRAREELARSADELRRANQDLEQFAYTASHDLQEPLRSIKIYSELLTRTAREKLEGKSLRYLEHLNEGARRMEVLLRDLLAYTQASLAGKTEQNVDAGECLAGTLANLSAAILESGAKVEAAPLPCLPVHPTHFQQLFQNLVGNAIKYRRPGVAPVVEIAAERQGDRWLFSVSDNGIGIDRKYQEQVFGLFKRLHTNDQYTGTGLGLAICRRIVESYDGRIWVESTAGAGSKFFFTLPAARSGGC